MKRVPLYHYKNGEEINSSVIVGATVIYDNIQYIKTGEDSDTNILNLISKGILKSNEKYLPPLINVENNLVSVKLDPYLIYSKESILETEFRISDNEDFYSFTSITSEAEGSFLIEKTYNPTYIQARYVYVDGFSSWVTVVMDTESYIEAPSIVLPRTNLKASDTISIAELPAVIGSTEEIENIVWNIYLNNGTNYPLHTITKPATDLTLPLCGLIPESTDLRYECYCTSKTIFGNRSKSQTDISDSYSTLALTEDIECLYPLLDDYSDLAGGSDLNTDLNTVTLNNGLTIINEPLTDEEVVGAEFVNNDYINNNSFSISIRLKINNLEDRTESQSFISTYDCSTQQDDYISLHYKYYENEFYIAFSIWDRTVIDTPEYLYYITNDYSSVESIVFSLDRDNNTASLYVNGEQVGSLVNSAVNIQNITRNIRLLGWHSSCTLHNRVQADAIINNFTIYNKVLTPEEAKGIYCDKK